MLRPGVALKGARAVGLNGSGQPKHGLLAEHPRFRRSLNRLPQRLRWEKGLALQNSASAE